MDPLQSYWSAIPLSDGWSTIYKISTLTIVTYVMNPIKLMFLPRGGGGGGSDNALVEVTRC